jgi:allantoate deiminase
MPQSPFSTLADEVLARCDVLARYSEEPNRIKRTCLCNAMHQVHASLRTWMERAGMTVRLDAAANLIGHYPAASADAPALLIASHLDSVPDAGKYDGILGVLLGVAAVEGLRGQRLPFAIDVLGFCEEEGIRFHAPYLGSLAVCGRLNQALLERTDDNGVSLSEALRHFGLDPTRVSEAAYRPDKVLGYLEAHIEQGPVLDNAKLPLGIVDAIVGTSRCWLRFVGKAGHAGTLPMAMRQDALAAAAEFIVAVDREARSVDGLRATVGSLAVAPDAVNVVPGLARLSLDVRHPRDEVRERAVASLLEQAAAIAARRGVAFHVDQSDSRGAVPTDPRLTGLLAETVARTGYPVHRMVSGAGHDAAVMATLTPVTMLFVRSPGGVSHHPAEAVGPQDVAAALEVIVAFLHHLAGDAR